MCVSLESGEEGGNIPAGGGLGYGAGERYSSLARGSR